MTASPPAFFWMKQVDKELEKKRGSGFHPAYYLETQNGGLRSISRNNICQGAAIILSKSAIFKVIILCDLKMKEFINYFSL